jgi:hypothetical protein
MIDVEEMPDHREWGASHTVCRSPRTKRKRLLVAATSFSRTFHEPPRASGVPRGRTIFLAACCLSAMPREAAVAGVSQTVINTAFAGLTADGAVLTGAGARERGAGLAGVAAHCGRNSGPVPGGAGDGSRDGGQACAGGVAPDIAARRDGEKVDARQVACQLCGWRRARRSGHWCLEARSGRDPAYVGIMPLFERQNVATARESRCELG